MDQVQQKKRELMEAAHKLKEAGLLFRGYHANLSARISEDTMILTSGGSVEHLDENGFALIRLDGQVIEGDIAPVMAEIIQMHAGVYRERPSVGCVIHTHAPHATSFAVAQQPIPVVYEPLVRFGVTEDIPVVPWAPRGSDASVKGIAQIVKDRPGVWAVLLANHGVLAFSRSISETVQLLATLDEAAEIVLNARMLGGEKRLPDQAFTQIQERMREFAEVKR
ncbi:class II aldolase/adducin family protein [Alicyclobacillus sendaiensis]|uniref:class II aldolase/adducin family protein n=1 Tax=Alicyclobacillus sendaiensis TaxID=192387 RepID=UPI0026F417A7|nr:class II aldolase/adducin family protein [Alicyclobacillus sendaiensis]